MLVIQPTKNLTLYNNVKNNYQKSNSQQYITKSNQNIDLRASYTHIMFQGARVDKTIQSFTERNKDKMINTVMDYIHKHNVNPKENALKIHKAAFALLALATNVNEIKDVFCSEENKTNGSYEPLFEDLKSTNDLNIKENIISAINYFKSLDIPLFKNSKDDLTTYLVKKLFLEAKTLDEINKDIENDLNSDLKTYIQGKNKDDSKFITANTLKALGIKYNQPYFNSLRYTRDGYSDMVGEKISRALLDCFNSLSDEEKSARSDRMKEVAQQRWNNMTPDEKAKQISRMLSVQKTQNGELLKYVMYDAWNHCPEIIKGLFKFLSNKDKKQTDMVYFENEIDLTKTKFLSEFWAKNPKFAQKWGDAISDGYRKFRLSHDCELLQLQIEEEREKRKQEFEDWKRRNGYVKTDITPNISEIKNNSASIDNKTLCKNKLLNAFTVYANKFKSNELYVLDIKNFCFSILSNEDYNTILKYCDTDDKIQDFIKNMLAIEDISVEDNELFDILKKIHNSNEYKKCVLSAYTAQMMYLQPTEEQQEYLVNTTDSLKIEAEKIMDDSDDKKIKFIKLIDDTKRFYKNLKDFGTFSRAGWQMLNNLIKDNEELKDVPLYNEYKVKIVPLLKSLKSDNLTNTFYKECKEKFSIEDINKIFNEYYKDRNSSEKREIRKLLEFFGKSLSILYFKYTHLNPPKGQPIHPSFKIEFNGIISDDDSLKSLSLPILQNLDSYQEYMQKKGILEVVKQELSILPQNYYDLYSKLINNIRSEDYLNIHSCPEKSAIQEFKNIFTEKEREQLLVARYLLNKIIKESIVSFSNLDFIYSFNFENSVGNCRDLRKTEPGTSLLLDNINAQLMKKINMDYILKQIEEYDKKLTTLHEEFGDNIPVQKLIQMLCNKNIDIKIQKMLETNIREYMLNPDSEYFN